MKSIPYVGQKVRLNDAGYQACPLRSRDAHKQADNMTITAVENINAGRSSTPIWCIDVDQPLINIFLLDATMVDPVPASAHVYQLD